MKALFVAATCVLLVGATLDARAYPVNPYTVTIEEVGLNVVATGTGEFDVAGLGYVGTTAECDCINGPAPYPYIDIGTPAKPGEYFVSFPANGPSSFGTDYYINATSGSGDPAGVGVGNFSGTIDWLLLPPAYQSGTVLSGNASFDNATIASLGLIPGTYVWSWGSEADQTFNLDILAPTPIPATLPLFAGGLGILGLFGAWKRRRAAAA